LVKIGFSMSLGIASSPALNSYRTGDALSRA
jgi:hypothetical protein